MAKLTVLTDESGNYNVVDQEGRWISTGLTREEAKENARKKIREDNKLFSDDKD